MIFKTERYIYIMEFKMGSADEALAQIQEKKYYEPFLSEGKEILMVGIGFNREDRNIVQFKYVKFE